MTTTTLGYQKLFKVITANYQKPQIKRRVMQKNHYLVNLRTNERMIVFPPKGPGLNEDWDNCMNANGEYIRVFKIVNTNGIKVFHPKKSLVLYNLPGHMPQMTDKHNDVWQVQEIPGVHSPKAHHQVTVRKSSDNLVRA